jgi:hypothetical protein
MLDGDPVGVEINGGPSRGSEQALPQKSSQSLIHGETNALRFI